MKYPKSGSDACRMKHKAPRRGEEWARGIKAHSKIQKTMV